MTRKKRTKIGRFHTVFRGRIYEVQQAHAVYSNGATAIFEQITRPDGAAVIPIDGKGRILIAREYRHKMKRYAWVFPGGRGDRGEKPVSIARRELQEEAGLKPKKLILFHVFQMHSTLAWKDYYFLGCNLVQSRLPCSEDEDIKLKAVTFQQALRMVMEGKIESSNAAFLINKLFRLRRQVITWAKTSGKTNMKFV